MSDSRLIRDLGLDQFDSWNEPDFEFYDRVEELLRSDDLFSDLCMLIAISCHVRGVQPNITTDIAGYISYGYGAMVDNGFWQCQLPHCCINDEQVKFIHGDKVFHAKHGTAEVDWVDPQDGTIGLLKDIGGVMRPIIVSFTELSLVA